MGTSSSLIPAMPHVLRRTCSSLLMIAALSWLPSCGFGTAGVALGMGGGGGGGSAPIYGLTRDVSIGSSQPKPGQVVAAEPANSETTFASDAVYDVTWRDSAGTARATAKARAMTNRRLALVVPLGLAGGDYKAEFALADGKAELVVPVGAVGALGDPATVVASARAWWGSQVDALRATADLDPDAGRKARSLADLARLSGPEGWLATFDAAVARLDAESKRTLAQLLDANADLRKAEPSDPFVSVDLIAAQSEAAAKLSEYGVSALAASSSVVAPAGSSAELEALLPASQMIGGLVAVLTAYDRWTKALAKPCKPIGPLQVTAADGSPLVLRFAQPLLLRCQVQCSSLVAADAADARVAGIGVALIDAVARRTSLFPTTTQSIVSLPPEVPTAAVEGLALLDPRRLVLVSQTAGSPGLPTLLLNQEDPADGKLRASQAVFQSGSLGVVLRVVEESLGTASGEFDVALDNSPPSDLDLVLIQPGTFQMGSPVTPLGVAPYFNEANSQPVHGVTITQPFYMGKYEVRQSEYLAVMGSNPSFHQGPSYPNAAQRPVERVTWIQAVAYCDALTVQEAAAGRLPAGYEYRLPTEAEWEYCCRAGTTTEFHYGSSLLCGQANFGFSFHSSSNCSAPGNVETIVVGSYAPNVWGLHDMHGNVWEWCLDSWDGTSANYPAGSVSDPYETSGPLRIVRGGGWGFNSGSCRAAYRNQSAPTFTMNYNGFRVVCAPVLP